MLRIVNFRKWQGAPITKALASRRGRIRAGEAQADSLNKPLALQSVSIATALDGDFGRFAEAVGGRSAEALFIRVLQYAAGQNALEGVLTVARARFGPIVLSRPWDIVTEKVGKHVYDSLISSGICVEQEETPHGTTRSDTDGDTSRAPRATLPDPTRPDPTRHTPLPPTAEGDGGGSFAAPVSANGSGRKRTLSDADRAVLDVLDLRYGEASAHSSPEWRKIRDARDALAAGTADQGQVLDLMNRLTPKYLAEVLDVRRAFTMASNQRKA